MSKKVAILQSNYIPWKGYFDLINQVDEFILYDDMQYTKNDWRNRNLIKSSQSLQWLTIPVKHRGRHLQKISETEIAYRQWGKKHWQSLLINYNKAKFFKHYKELFEDLYLQNNEQLLSRINARFLTEINKILKINTTISWSSDYQLTGEKTERLVNLCLDAKASEYISGPSAKTYLDISLFSEANIKVTWMDYSNYPVYPQLHVPFEHGVSILDLIFNQGPNATHYMKSFDSAYR